MICRYKAAPRYDLLYKPPRYDLQYKAAARYRLLYTAPRNFYIWPLQPRKSRVYN